MRSHLIECFENGVLVPFPKYQSTRINTNVIEQDIISPWKKPRRSQRLVNKLNKHQHKNKIPEVIKLSTL